MTEGTPIPETTPRLGAGRMRLLAGGLVAAVLILVVLVVVVLPRLEGDVPGGSIGAPRFVEEATTAGLTHTYGGGPAFSVGGGVAVFDCNGDGKPDIYLSGGSNPAALYRNDSPVGGALKFTPLPDPVTDLPDVSGAYPIDLDGDGKVDLAVLRVGGLEMLRGLGDCRFAPANQAWSIDAGTGWTTAFSATWEGSAVLPTLAVGNYRQLDATGAPGSDCSGNELLRPNDAGTGYGAALPLTPGYCTLSVLFSDWARSGRRDLRITNDRNYAADAHEQLWRVVPGEAPTLYTDADGWASLQIWGMGIASYDLTGDGYPDVFLTSQADNKLQTLTSGPNQPTYRDIAVRRGVNSAHPFTGGDVLPSTAWHPEFQDVNNDGFIDLFISKGNVSAQPDYAMKDPSDLFLGQADGTFVEAADRSGILSFDSGRGAALADFNLDGLLDLVEVNVGTPVELWRNVGTGDAGHPAAMGNWLALTLNEPGPNHDAIGSWVKIKAGDVTMSREITIGGGHISGELGWTHFGLGSAGDAQVQVQWPDGQTSAWMPIKANTFGVVDRAAGAVQPWQPPAN